MVDILMIYIYTYIYTFYISNGAFSQKQTDSTFLHLGLSDQQQRPIWDNEEKKGVSNQ
jgi:hypothetical protein